MPPYPTCTTTCPGPGSPASCSTTRRSSGALITRQVQRSRIGTPSSECSTSIKLMLVSNRDSDHGGQQGPAGKVGRQVLAHQLAHRATRLHGAAGVMRLQHDVVKGHEP